MSSSLAWGALDQGEPLLKGSHHRVQLSLRLAGKKCIRILWMSDLPGHSHGIHTLRVAF